MAFTGITVNTPAENEAHIYAEDDAAIYQSIFGVDGVLDIGSKLSATIQSNNTIRISDGVIVCGGHIGRNRHADYTDVTIANGISGRNRIDLIVAEFSTTGFGGMDSYAIKNIKGTETAGTPQEPDIAQTDIYAGGKVRQYPLYRVTLNGAIIVSVEKIFQIIPTIPDAMRKHMGNSVVLNVTPANGMATLVGYQEVNKILGTNYNKNEMSYYVNVTAQNGDYTNNYVQITSTCYNTQTGTYDVFFNKTMGGLIRINYMITIIREK